MVDVNEYNFQKSVGSQEEWEEVIFNEGVQVIDVYQNWCGACKPISKFLWRLKTELNDKMLHFVTAKCDNIESLEAYRGRCEPCFMIFGNGILVGVMRGCNPPSLGSLIKLKLEEEHLALKGLFDKIEIKDPYFKYLEDLKTEEEMAKDYIEAPAEVVLAIIKPDIVMNNTTSEVISMILKENITVLHEEERIMTEEEAESLYAHLQDMDFHNSLMKYMTSETCYFLILMKDEGIIDELRTLIGPKSLEEAKIYHSESIRALYAKSAMENAIHCGEDKETCEREMKLFYPDYEPPLVKLKRDVIENIQITLALIRPSALRDFKDRIIQSILDNEFQILKQHELKFTRSEAESFYVHLINDDYYEDLILEMIEGPFLVLALSRKDAINKWRALMGSRDLSFAKKYEPQSLRAEFSKSNVFVNLLHGSDSVQAAQKELKYFFPIEQTVAAIKPDSFDNRDEILELINEFGFKISASKEVLLTREDILVIYKKHLSKVYFTDLVKYMTSGNSLFLVLSKEDAIKEWRAAIGPTDPELAVEENSDYLRALYGRDILENAIFGASDKEEATNVLKLIFGEIKFDEDGNLIEEHQEFSSEDYEEVLRFKATQLVDEIITSSTKIFQDHNVEHSD